MPTHISFASFNLLNFHEIGGNMYGHVVSEVEYNQKKEWVQNKLIEIDADVIAFQELWAPSCLEDVFSHNGLSGYSIEYIKSDGGRWYNIAVAVAIRRPWRVKGRDLHKKFPFTNIYRQETQGEEDDEVEVKIKRFSRTIIELIIGNVDEESIPEFRVFAAHLKAKKPMGAEEVPTKHERSVGSALSTIRRTAEAAALRWLLTEQMKDDDKPVVLLGDLNDDPKSNTLTLLTQQPSLASSARGSDTALYSTLQFQQLKSFKDIFYTHEFNRVKDTIDHVLVSREFFDSYRKAQWEHVETVIFNDHLHKVEKSQSDHGIIKTTFKKV